jgi:predicted lipoprotein with Yx(FWY)xxD motif
MPDQHDVKMSALTGGRATPRVGPARTDRGARRRAGRAASAVGAVTLASLGLVAYASAVQATITIRQAKNATLGERVVVDLRGRTLYALAPESPHHLLCKSEACFKFWPPLTVRSRRVRLEAGPGVHGRLAILRRRGGIFQVMLRGMPLYRFAGDHGRDQANGQGIVSFGGTWHAVTATKSDKVPAASHPRPGSSSGSAPGTPAGGGAPGGEHEVTGSSGAPTTTTVSSTTAQTTTTSATVTTSSYAPGW